MKGLSDAQSYPGSTTVIVVELKTAPSCAPIVVVPAPSPVARPRDPAALETTAIAGLPDDQTASAVRSWVVLSLKMPVAVNCAVPPVGINGFDGVRLIATSDGTVVVVVVVPGGRWVSGVQATPMARIAPARPNRIAKALIARCALIESPPSQGWERPASATVTAGCGAINILLALRPVVVQSTTL